MKVQDKELKKDVDVCAAECVEDGRMCYWPRPDPGVFVQGRGYKSRGGSVSEDYICGTRAIHGCPDEFCD